MPRAWPALIEATLEELMTMSHRRGAYTTFARARKRRTQRLLFHIHPKTPVTARVAALRLSPGEIGCEIGRSVVAFVFYARGRN